MLSQIATMKPLLNDAEHSIVIVEQGFMASMPTIMRPFTKSNTSLGSASIEWCHIAVASLPDSSVGVKPCCQR